MTTQPLSEREPPPPLAGGADGGKSPLYAHYVLAVLCLANILSIADRNIMGILLEPMKRDLHASDTAMSLLSGASFVIFYSLFGIPIARWADRGNRRSILAIGIGVWSLATSACGLAGNVAIMALARAGVGMGESTCTPTSMSLISDYYRKSVRPQIISIFNLATYGGGIFITPLIGIITQAFGWRHAFILMGLPGLLVALLVRFTIREPVRGATDVRTTSSTASPQTLGEVLKIMYRSKPFMLILIGTALCGMGAGTFGAWGFALMMRAFHVTPKEVASIAAPISAMAGITGTLLGGFVTGWLAKKRRSERWILILPALASILSVPAGLLVNFGPAWAWTIAGMSLGSFSVGFRLSPYMALMMELVPANCRGMAAAASVIATSLVGQAGGPLIVGMVSDHLKPTLGPVLALRYAFTFAPITLALGLIPFFMALKYFDANGVKREAAVH